MQQEVPDALPGLRGAHEGVRLRGPSHVACSGQQPEEDSGARGSRAEHTVHDRDGQAARRHLRRRQLAGHVQQSRSESRNNASIKRVSDLL